MERVSIIGCSGSGKSTLARRMGELLSLSVIHLDQHFWQPGWQATPKELWREKVKELVSGERWIVDGNYRSSMDLRLPRSDTIVFLDYPTWRCVLRVYKRALGSYGVTRADLAADCPEKLPDWEFLTFILGFRKNYRPDILEWIEKVKAERRIVWCRHPDEAEGFVQSL